MQPPAGPPQQPYSYGQPSQQQPGMVRPGAPQQTGNQAGLPFPGASTPGPTGGPGARPSGPPGPFQGPSPPSAFGQPPPAGPFSTPPQAGGSFPGPPGQRPQQGMGLAPPQVRPGLFPPAQAGWQPAPGQPSSTHQPRTGYPSTAAPVISQPPTGPPPVSFTSSGSFSTPPGPPGGARPTYPMSAPPMGMPPTGPPGSQQLRSPTPSFSQVGTPVTSPVSSFRGGPPTVPFSSTSFSGTGVPSQAPPQSPRQKQAAAPYGDGLPPSYPGPPGAPPGPPAVSGPYDYNAQSMTEDFQSLALAPSMGPGGAMDAIVDPSYLPRPTDRPDEGPVTAKANADPRYVRLTCTVMPNSSSLRTRWHLPLGAVVHPLAPAPPGEEVPVVNFGSSGIVRCRRCRTYINPYVAFTDAGRRWRCNVCGLLNEVPVDYFCALDDNGRRLDADERPELSKGSVEFVAPAEYMVRPPMPPVYFFVIDVSAAAAASGLLPVMCQSIKSCLDRLPGDSRTQVGFLTYDSTLHFYSLKSSLTQPQMMVVSDLEDPFLPMPDDLLVNLQESRAVVEALLDSLPSFFTHSANVESALGPALQAAYLVMSNLGGKLLLFQSTLPSLGQGRLKLRGEDPKLYGTEREHTLRVSEEHFYKKLAAECSRVQMSVNCYLFSSQYTDVASIGTLSKYTGGQVYYYPGFRASRDGEKFSKELCHDLSRVTGWEAVMRIRCGRGLKISSFHGHFFIRSTDLLALPAVDEDKAFAVQISHEETLLTTPTVYFQCALLYTSSSGERRIRVHTVAAPVIGDLGEMYRAADCGAAVNLLAKLAYEKSLSDKLEACRTMVTSKVASALREYRGLYAAARMASGGGKFIYPETLRLLSIYTLALIKSAPLRGGFLEVQADERSAVGYELMNMSVPRVLKLLYPTLYRLDHLPPEVGLPGQDGQVVLPAALPLSADKLDVRGAFLLDDGVRIIIWLGKVIPPEFVQQLLGLDPATGPDLAQVVLALQPSEVSRKVTNIVAELRRGNALHQQVVIMRQGEPREAMFVPALVEDRGPGGVSYVEWLSTLHRQVQQKA